MKKIIYNIFIFLIISTLFIGCKDDDVMVGAVTIQEAELNTNDNVMQISLKDNETLQLNAFILPRDATNKNIIFINNTPEIMEVSNEGIITPKLLGDEWLSHKIGSLSIQTTDGSNIKTTYDVKIINHIIKATGINVTAAGKNMTLEVGSAPFDLGSKVSVAPNETTDKRVTYKSKDESIATVDAQGFVTAIEKGNTQIVITTADGTNIETECNVSVIYKFTGPLDLDRSNWVVTVSHPDKMPVDAGISNAIESLIDGNNATCLSIVKPGKTYGDITTPADAILSFTIDMTKEEEFEYFRIRHRDGNSNTGLRVAKISIYSSNNGTDFTLIQENVTLTPDIENIANIETDNMILPKTKCRYVKVTYDDFGVGAGSAAQIAEFNLGNTIE